MGNYSLINADIFGPDGIGQTPLCVVDEKIGTNAEGKSFDLGGFTILPGIADLHGDGFERHLAPRRGVVENLQVGFDTMRSELAVNGITTAVLAQFYSWEGGMRSPEFALSFLDNLTEYSPKVATGLIPQLRFETHMLDHYGRFGALCERYRVPCSV